MTNHYKLPDGNVQIAFTNVELFCKKAGAKAAMRRIRSNIKSRRATTASRNGDQLIRKKKYLPNR